MLSNYHQQVILHYVLSCGYSDFRYSTVTLCQNSVLHLHALQCEQRVAFLHGLSLAYQHFDNRSGEGRGYLVPPAGAAAGTAFGAGAGAATGTALGAAGAGC